MNFNDYDLSEFLSFIRQEFSSLLNKQKIPKCWYAKVNSIGTGGAIVILAGDTQPVTGIIPNKSNETLSINDNVVLFSPTGNLGNCVILFKF